VGPSQHPMLHLQEVSAIHTIVFRMDASGRGPTVAQHRISGGLPAYLAFYAENDHLLMVKGRKGLCFYEENSELEFCTGLLGIEELAGGFDAELKLPDDWSGNEQGVRIVDFDERTGRILIGTNWRGAEYEEPNRIYFADLPP